MEMTVQDVSSISQSEWTCFHFFSGGILLTDIVSKTIQQFNFSITNSESFRGQKNSYFQKFSCLISFANVAAVIFFPPQPLIPKTVTLLTDD